MLRLLHHGVMSKCTGSLPSPWGHVKVHGQSSFTMGSCQSAWAVFLHHGVMSKCTGSLPSPWGHVKVHGQSSFTMGSCQSARAVFLHHGVMSKCTGSLSSPWGHVKVHGHARSTRLKIKQEAPTTTSVFAGSCFPTVARTVVAVPLA